MALQKVQATTILCRAVVTIEKTSSKLGVLSNFVTLSPCMTCFVLPVMGLGPKFVISALRSPYCVFYIWGVIFCLDFGSFLFPSLVPFLGVFPLFLCLQQVVQIH
jgi:hypothetical protein